MSARAWSSALLLSLVLWSLILVVVLGAAAFIVPAVLGVLGVAVRFGAGA